MSGFNDIEISDMEALAVLGGVILIVALIALIFAVVTYVLSSVGIYTIAKRRGIKNPWMAWIPVANAWILGSISDQYQYVVKRKNTNRRLILVILSGISVLLGSVGSGSYFDILANAAVGSDAATAIMGPVMAITGAGFLSTGVSIAYTVFRYIALYDLYSSSRPQNNVLFLVLGIFFGITEPFFIFACRNKDDGMPPRRTDNPYQQPPHIQEENSWQPQQSQPEPWEKKDNE